MEAGHWLDERKFEMTDDYPASKVIHLPLLHCEIIVPTWRYCKTKKISDKSVKTSLAMKSL